MLQNTCLLNFFLFCGVNSSLISHLHWTCSAFEFTATRSRSLVSARLTPSSPSCSHQIQTCRNTPPLLSSPCQPPPAPNPPSPRPLPFPSSSESFIVALFKPKRTRSPPSTTCPPPQTPSAPFSHPTPSPLWSAYSKPPRNLPRLQRSASLSWNRLWTSMRRGLLWLQSLGECWQQSKPLRRARAGQESTQ